MAKLNLRARQRIERKATNEQWEAFREFQRLQAAANAIRKEIDEQRKIIAATFPRNALYALSPDEQSVIRKVITEVAAYEVAAHVRTSYVLETV